MDFGIVAVTTVAAVAAVVVMVSVLSGRQSRCIMVGVYVCACVCVCVTVEQSLSLRRSIDAQSAQSMVDVFKQRRELRVPLGECLFFGIVARVLGELHKRLD